jgi:hypothetical protein
MLEQQNQSTSNKIRFGAIAADLTNNEILPF